MALEDSMAAAETGTQQEPGAVDNRLTLNPSDFPFTKDWEDGKDYPGEIDGNKVNFNQISPGEFEVTNEAETPAEDANATDENESGNAMPMHENPAVAVIIANRTKKKAV